MKAEVSDHARTLCEQVRSRLERSGGTPDWALAGHLVDGSDWLTAGLRHTRFGRHRHDTYTISVTLSGIQEFTYLGAVHRSAPGHVVVLHPDEPHDGRPATADGFCFTSLYLSPDVVFAAMREQAGVSELPFIENPVLPEGDLTVLLSNITRSPLEDLFLIDAWRTVASVLLRHSTLRRTAQRRRGVGDAAMALVRDYLHEHFRTNVRAEELERLAGATRYRIAADFKRRNGVSPYRYLLMRRLAWVRHQLAGNTSLSRLALDAGFCDQAHMTRLFTQSFGMSPNAYRRLLGR